MARGRPRKSDDMLLKSAEMIGWAIGGIEREIAHTRERLATLTEQASQLRARVGGGAATPAAAGGSPEPAGAAPKKTRRRMSVETRKQISEKMKRAWAERKKKSSKT